MITETLESLTSLNLWSGARGFLAGAGAGALLSHAEYYPSRVIKYGMPLAATLLGDLIHPSIAFKDDLGLLAGMFAGYFTGDKVYDYIRTRRIMKDLPPRIPRD